MKNPIKTKKLQKFAKTRKSRRLENLLELSEEIAEKSGRWIYAQLLRGMRYIWWETDREIFLQWAQSIIKTEIRLRETTQRESYLKELIQYQQSYRTVDEKSRLEALIEELISLDRDYRNLEQSYVAVIAKCPEGSMKSAYLSFRRQPQWHMMSQWLRQDCANRGGCCGRACQCCENLPDPRRVKGLGHCTEQCGCCHRARGFSVTEEDRERMNPHFDLTANPRTAYSREMFLAHIWSLH
jgi:hypothetical protein